VCQRLAMDF